MSYKEYRTTVNPHTLVLDIYQHILGVIEQACMTVFIEEVDCCGIVAPLKMSHRIPELFKEGLVLTVIIRNLP